MSYYYKVDEQEEDAEYPTTSLEIAYEELPEPTPDWSNRYRWEQRRNSTISQTPIATPTIPTAIPTETIQTESLEATPTEISYDSLNNVPSMYIPGLSNQAFWAVLSVAIIAILAGILYCWARRNRKRSAEKIKDVIIQDSINRISRNRVVEDDVRNSLSEVARQSIDFEYLRRGNTIGSKV